MELLEDCEEALKLDPESVWAFGWRGRAKAHHEDLKGAYRDCGEALELEPPTTHQYVWTWPHWRCVSAFNAEDIQYELEAALAGDPHDELPEKIERLERAIGNAAGVEALVVKPETLEKASAQVATWKSVVEENGKLNSPDQNIKKAAAAALGELRDYHAVPFLLVALNTQHNPFVRHKVMEALGVIGDESAIPSLQRATHMAAKAKDRETEELSKLAILETRRDIDGIEIILSSKRTKEWLRGPAEVALARLRKAQQEEQERQAALLPS